MDHHNKGGQQLIGSLGLGHDDFVHDVSFDFYGNQMATCSTD